METRPDVDRIFLRLVRSDFRAKQKLRAEEARYFLDKGLTEILAHARQFVIELLADAQPENDGKQTPMRGHPVFVAQHATATCCRGCLMKWHGIAAGHELSDDDVEYIVTVVDRWLCLQDIPSMDLSKLSDEESRDEADNIVEMQTVGASADAESVAASVLAVETRVESAAEIPPESATEPATEPTAEPAVIRIDAGLDKVVTGGSGKVAPKPTRKKKPSTKKASVAPADSSKDDEEWVQGTLF